VNVSPKLVAFVQKMEGCKLSAYKDAEGWSIGYGHFGVKEGDTCTQEQADEWLQEDLDRVAVAVNRAVTRGLSQGQFDALCDFAYNVGVTALDQSKMLHYVNNYQDAWAVDHLMLYVYSQGKVVEALVERRSAERDMYEGKG
jgi:lysozyme